MRNATIWRGMAVVCALFFPVGAIAMYVNRKKCDDWSWFIFGSSMVALPITLPLFFAGAEDAATAINFVASTLPFILWQVAVRRVDPARSVKVKAERREADSARRAEMNERRMKQWEDEMIGVFERP